MSESTLSKTHEIYINRNGSTSLRHIQSGEVMHSSIGPKEEATLLYIEQSKLSECLSKKSNDEPLVLFDVGLGAATNALAALQCQKATASQNTDIRELQLFSFESDISGIKLALSHKKELPFFEGFETAVETLVEKKTWVSTDEKLKWHLKEGHFLEHLNQCPAPELIFFDFYSPKVNPELWSVSMFESVYQACKPRLGRNSNTMLFTYSASTRVRVALLLAGFYVGYGRSTGAKTDTSTASLRLDALDRPLDERWIQRFEKSHERMPYGWSTDREVEVVNRVLSHPQFQSKK